MRNKLKEVKKIVDDADRARKAAMTEAVSRAVGTNLELTTMPSSLPFMIQTTCSLTIQYYQKQQVTATPTVTLQRLLRSLKTTAVAT